MFEPRVALASLSGRSDAAWARAGLPHVGAAFLGGIALDRATRTAARRLLERDRDEFLPPDPFQFVDDQLARLEDAPLLAGFNVRASTPAAILRAARICRSRGVMLEVNAHCRQAEMCAAGAGEALLREPARLAEQVEAATSTGATVSVKVRAEVPGVDLVRLARSIEAAGADVIHVDAMDDEPVVGTIAGATDLFVVANNGVRDAASAGEYLDLGADAVSVGRASDEPATLAAVRRAVERRRAGDAGRPVEP